MFGFLFCILIWIVVLIDPLAEIKHPDRRHTEIMKYMHHTIEDQQNIIFVTSFRILWLWQLESLQAATANSCASKDAQVAEVNWDFASRDIDSLVSVGVRRISIWQEIESKNLIDWHLVESRDCFADLPAKSTHAAICQGESVLVPRKISTLEVLFGLQNHNVMCTFWNALGFIHKKPAQWKNSQDCDAMPSVPSFLLCRQQSLRSSFSHAFASPLHGPLVEVTGCATD